MSLLTLKGIGKIYVSEGNVSVGIRGVDLSFERGEFVAVTGRSGSGKSTLLSVISGMDTYEEGDLLIEGRSTAHYGQPDWEDYRQKYISFIFQDYNIIESFTVLQNVELALMHITDPRERRRRALELIRRVGLTSHLRQKGSKLSGGQKQRTVIARALAKDSPIILADEPTGNLDSETGREIVELLREVSRDKLVIVVTHNFEQVAYCATRHIRIFDGAVASDERTKTDSSTAAASAAPTSAPTERVVEPPRVRTVRGGVQLGRAMFSSRPRLTAFMCLLLAVGMLGLFFATSMFDGMNDLFEPNRMFCYVPGRVVLTRQDGVPLTDSELEGLAARHGATDSLHYDKLIDQGTCYLYSDETRTSSILRYAFGETVSEKVFGRYPTAADEVLLSLPIHMKPDYGTDPEAAGKTFTPTDALTFRVVGVSYFCDNTEYGRAIFTEAGYGAMLGSLALFENGFTQATLTLSDGTMLAVSDVALSNRIADGSYGILMKETGLTVTSVSLQTEYYNFGLWDGEDAEQNSMTWTLDPADRVPLATDTELPDPQLLISPALATELVTEYLSRSYRQASLFFESDRAAERAAKALSAEGYVAVTSDETYVPDADETILATLLAFFALCAWGLVILFIAFFISLCSSRTIGTFRGDLAVMRSMGIPVKVIRVAMYVRMLGCLIPAVCLQVAVSILIYTSPSANALFPYLHAGQYILLGAGLLLVTVRVTHKQIRRLFGQSVKKALKGGNAE